MAEDTIPTPADILDGIPAVIYRHGDLLTAQARSVITGAIRNGEDPAVVAASFCTVLMQRVVDEHAEISEREVADMIATALYLVRGFALGKAYAEEARPVAA